MKTKLILSATTAAFLGMSGLALAQTSVIATTDLNVRAGPGPEHPVVGVIGAQEQAMLEGCLADSKWCQVNVDGTQGWAYSDYLTGDFGGSAVVVTERPAEAVPVVTYETTASTTTGGGAIAGAATGAIAGALIAGPVGAAIGGVAGAATGDTIERIDPPETVRTYVSSNQLEPVYLEGEVVVGAGLPETVVLNEIPDYEYRYVYVNGVPVLVEPQSRRIVHVMR